MGRPQSLASLADEVWMEASVLHREWDPRERLLLPQADERLAWVEQRLAARGALTPELAQLALARDEIRELTRRNRTEDQGHMSIIGLAAEIRGHASAGHSLATVA